MFNLIKVGVEWYRMSCVCVDRGCVCVCVLFPYPMLFAVCFIPHLKLKSRLSLFLSPIAQNYCVKYFFSQFAYICLLVARIFVQFNCSMVNYLKAGIENCLRTYDISVRISIRTVGYWFRLQHIFLNCATSFFYFD